MSCDLFADDTMKVSMYGEEDKGIRLEKCVLNDTKEMNNGAKEEVLEFEMDLGGGVSV